MPLNIDFQQILLHLFNFIILFAGLYFLLYNPVKRFMEKRQQGFKDADDKAKAQLAESEKSKAEYEQKLSAFETEMQDRKNEARASAEAAAQKTKAKADEEAAAIVAKAKEEGEREKAKIIAQAQTEIANIVNEAAQKLAVNASSSDEIDRFLDAAEGSTENGQ